MLIDVMFEREQDNDIWWPLATAAIAMFGLIYSTSVLGDALRDAWDPRLDEAVAEA